MDDVRHTWFAAVSERLRAIIHRRIAEQVGRRPYECEAISDLTHEAFVAAVERLDEFRGATEAELVAWVSAIAKRKLCDHRRAMRRKRRDVRRTRPLGAFGEAL